MGGITFKESDPTEVIRVVPHMLSGGRTVLVILLGTDGSADAMDAAHEVASTLAENGALSGASALVVDALSASVRPALALRYEVAETRQGDDG